MANGWTLERRKRQPELIRHLGGMPLCAYRDPMNRKPSVLLAFGAAA
jgi:hypothetical protein